MGLVLGESGGTKPCVFLGKVTPAGDEMYLGCSTGAAGAVPGAIGSCSVFCKDWCVIWT